eukprot:jgi/Tetstr1/420477/TSEL_011590.t1
MFRDDPYKPAPGVTIWRVNGADALEVEAYLEHVPEKLGADEYMAAVRRRALENLRIHGVTTTKEDAEGSVTRTHEVELSGLRPERNDGSKYGAFVKLWIGPDDARKIEAWDAALKVGPKWTDTVRGRPESRERRILYDNGVNAVYDGLKRVECKPFAEEGQWIRVGLDDINRLVFGGDVVYDLEGHFRDNPGYPVRATVTPLRVWRNSKGSGLKLVAASIANVPSVEEPGDCPYCVRGVGETEDCTCGESGDES